MSATQHYGPADVTCPYCGVETGWTKRYESENGTLEPMPKLCGSPECRRQARREEW